MVSVSASHGGSEIERWVSLVANGVRPSWLRRVSIRGKSGRGTQVSTLAVSIKDIVECESRFTLHSAVRRADRIWAFGEASFPCYISDAVREETGLASFELIEVLTAANARALSRVVEIIHAVSTISVTAWDSRALRTAGSALLLKIQECVARRLEVVGAGVAERKADGLCMIPRVFLGSGDSC